MTATRFHIPEEPVLDVDDIQGNVLPGFMKPHMRLVSLVFGDVGKARAFLRGVDVTSLRDVLGSRDRVRAVRGLQPAGDKVGAVPDDLDDLWLNLGVSYAGLMKLAGRSEHLRAEVEAFTDNAFRLGLCARSPGLGDPVDSHAEGHPANWVVGGPGRQVDLVIIVAADDDQRLAQAARDVCRRAREHDLDVLHEDTGLKLDSRGSEHFGFQDGISQPGVRGRINEHEFLAYRLILDEPDKWLYGLPGQLLVWPGEFVFGYPASSPDPLVPGPVRVEGPAWSRNGSYLVYRRLRQDVAGFWSFIARAATALRSQDGFSDWTDDRLAAALVGRWKSGAPLLRAPREDNEALGTDRLANNNFGYAKPAGALTLVNGRTTGGWPEAVADPIGVVCPQAAHIRKVSTRATANDMGASRASLERRILRRGLPYGERLATPTNRDSADGDRGLLFVSYQASIERQFEFLTTRWMGSPTNPRSPGGHDMLVGQNGQPGQHRQRRCRLLGEAIGSGRLATATIVADDEFVIPTGGGYFFSPSISALRNTLSANE
jgi:Dyp-type peroxidase family